MPVIELRRTIAAPPEVLVEIAQDIESYPSFMPDVKSVKVLEKSEDGLRQKSAWVGIIRQFAREVKWVQEDEWNPEKTRVDYRQTEGDYDSMSGYWEFRPADGGTEFICYFDYEYNVPTLGKLISKIVDFLVRQNLKGILDAFERRAEELAGKLAN